MSSAIITFTVWWMLASGAPSPAVGISPGQTAPTEPSSQSEAAPASTVPASPPTAKPCPAPSASTSATHSDCTPPTKIKKHKPRPAVPPAGAPTKTVIRNGSTGDPTLAISPGVSQQQASKQLETTSHLVAMTQENLKILESRDLSAGQEDTVEQIRSYIKQSKKAEDEKDVQRAYNLANKARMLSGDLVKHSAPTLP